MVEAWQMEAYERLRIEIVRAAVKDLRKALRKSDRLGAVCNEQKDLEEWFLSQWGQLMCEDRGEYILEKCRETYKTRSFGNGKRQLPDDAQKEIYAEWKKRTSFAEINRKYGISQSQLYFIIRRWEK